MSEAIVQLNEEVIQGQLKELVPGSIEGAPDELLAAPDIRQLKLAVPSI